MGLRVAMIGLRPIAFVIGGCMSHASQMPEVNGLFDRPCFPEETLVLTDAGLKPIEDIEINDMVLTHMNRFRRVRAVDSHKPTLFC